MNSIPEAEPGKHEWQNWAVFIFLAFIWGGSFILIKKGLISFSPLQVGCMRIALSGLAFVPIFLLSGIKFPKGKVLLVTLVVLTGNGVPAVMFALAETRLGSAVTGVLNSLTPIFSLMMGVFFFGTKLKGHHLIGLLLGCIGITVLMVGEQDWRISSYVLFVVFGTLCYGTSANLVKRYCQDIHPIAITSVGFWVLGIISMIILFLTGAGKIIMQPETWRISMPALITLAVVCTVIANILFYRLLQKTSAIFGSAIAYAIPCMALVWGSLDGEVITWYQFAGFGFIVAAVYTLRKK